MNTLKSDHIIMATLPPDVSKIFYKPGQIMYWSNHTGTAFNDSVPHDKKEIRKAIEWLVELAGGTVTWSKP